MGKNLAMKQARAEKGLSQQELADKLADTCGGMAAVLDKAINICSQCIGIG